MIDPELIDAFIKYIKFPTKSLDENELVDNAPITAVLAFEEFQEIKKNAEQMGIEV
jgi:hypothetical protein